VIFSSVLKVDYKILINIQIISNIPQLAPKTMRNQSKRISFAQKSTRATPIRNGSCCTNSIGGRRVQPFTPSQFRGFDGDFWGSPKNQRQNP
jgi:hypothetical protein